eukprot:c7017_g1_i2.p1 GENE.c7017_g1_i2~~c7017_g1_i2.p1  ORF type:complete len:403 (+),score=66.59 c7017_g1_i2:226-1434(+)
MMLLSRLVSPAHILINMIKEQMIWCLHENCTDMIPLEHITKHESECPRGPTSCPHPSCLLHAPGSIKRKDLAHHTANCEWRELMCPNNCGQAVVANEMTRHIESSCINSSVFCERCGQRVTVADLNKHHKFDCSNAVIKCGMPDCKFEAERGARQLWEKHLGERSVSHLHGMMQLVSEQSHTIQELKNTSDTQINLFTAQEQQLAKLENSAQEKSLTLDEQQQQLAVIHSSSKRMVESMLTLLSQTLNVPPNSVDWILKGFASRWEAGTELFSSELRFNYVYDPSLRYSFKIHIRLNCDRSKDHVGVYFIPRRGPNHTALKWPIQNKIQMCVLNFSGTGRKVGLLDGAGARDTYALLCPPSDDSVVGPGTSKFLTKSELMAGDFVTNDSLVIRMTIMDELLS